MCEIESEKVQVGMTIAMQSKFAKKWESSLKVCQNNQVAKMLE